ncbi:MAG TPA: tetratricopeptide repeat protein [Acidobacteriota bacterium]|nr:tetratricopeptide repeat protein [Acidobacteriota bacterium]
MTLIVKVLALLIALFPTLDGDDNAYQHYLRANYYLRTARPQQAVTELRKVVEADPDAAAPRVTLGRVLLGLNRPDEALAELEKAEQLSPEDPAIPRLIGRVSLQIAAAGGGETFAGKAEQAFKRALELDSEEQESLFFLAMLYEQTGRLDEAITAKQRLLELSPSLRDVWLSLANSLREKGAREEELNALEHAIGLDDGSPELLRRAGETAEFLREFVKANDYFDRSVDLISEQLLDNPGDPILLLQRANIYLWNTGQYDRTVEDCNLVIASNDSGVASRAQLIEALIAKASALQLMADYEPAAEIFEQYEEIVLGQLTRSFEDMVFSYAQTGRVDKALNLLQQLGSSGRYPGQSNYFARLRAQILDNGGRQAQAAEILENLISTQPTDSQNYLLLCQFKVNSNEFEAAEAVLDRGEASAGEQRGFVFMRGVVAERRGDFAGAAEAFRELVEADPKDHLALNYLGYMMADRKINLLQAKELIERALEVQPHNGSYLDSLGWAFFKLGDSVKAEEYLKASMRTQYRSAEVREHLGRLYLALDRQEDALAEFRAALELGLHRLKPTDEVEELIAELERKLSKDGNDVRQ